MKPPAGAVVLACTVTLPKSIGRLRLSSSDPRTAPHIHYNFFDDQDDPTGWWRRRAPVPENRPNCAVLGPDRR